MKPAAVFGFAVVGGLVVLRVAAALLTVDSFAATDAAMLGPSLAHLLGTDQLGRDVVVRMVESTEAFVLPGLVACLVAVGLGVPAGSIAGYWPRSRLAGATRFTLTIVGAWPRLVVVIVVVSIFVRSVSDPARWGLLRLYLLAAVLGLSFVPQLAQALSEKVLYFQREQFVEAARAHGLSDGRILGFHILWANCRALVLRQACMLFGAFVLVETSLSYLGDYGVPPPRPSWGNILAGVRSQVIHARSLMIPETLTPSGVAAGLGRAIQDGGLLALAAPTVAIVVTIAGVLALAEHFAEGESG